MTPTFKANIQALKRRYKSIQEDVDLTLNDIKIGKFLGDKIQGVSHVVYKLRLKNRDAQRGKRGGYRLIYCVVLKESLIKVGLLTIYSKSDQEDISTKEVIHIIQQFSE
jgi:mRNA-degrading endonuclease RelE of RelBE toxin-antitoxin system